MAENPSVSHADKGAESAPKPVKVRVTPTRDNYGFAGKTFKIGADAVSVSELGFDRATMEKAHADPNLVIEFYDKSGAFMPHETGYSGK